MQPRPIEDVVADPNTDTVDKPPAPSGILTAPALLAHPQRYLAGIAGLSLGPQRKSSGQPGRMPGMAPDDLLAGPPDTLLPADPGADRVEAGEPPADVIRTHPASSGAWAALAEAALAAGSDVEAYAYARTGYHRGLDALRRAGWRGQGPIPWSHHPNRGFLRALAALARAAAAIGEADEAERCRTFLADSSPEASAELLG